MHDLETTMVEGWPPLERGELGGWLLRGLAARVEDRFEDALEMRIAWRQVVRATRRAEDQRPWWRRLIEGIQEDAPVEPPSGW